MSILGIGHTIISIMALIAAVVSFFKDGAINPFSGSGKLYTILTAIACISAFGLSSTGHFNPGHALAILILLLLALAYLFGQKRKPVFSYIVIFCMTTTVFLSLVPAANETLSRLPVGHPLANGPTSPIVQNTIKVLLVLFLAGLITQFWRLKRRLNKI